MRKVLIVCFCALSALGMGQNATPLINPKKITTNKPDQPKIIVGIVVDQMRYDYLYRYRKQYGKGGFNRLLQEGFSCESAHYDYVPTYTGPGHAAIYTGTTPSVNGIISNGWFDPEWGKKRYVTEDRTVKTVGAPGDVGQHSPRVMVSSTITDELRLSNNFQSKVVGVCLKDRGGILPAGHIPNACYWFDDATGNWITSTYYPDSLGLPKWVNDFNQQGLPGKYLAQPWNTVHPQAAYTESFSDWEKYEKRLSGDPNGTLPKNLPALKNASSGFGVIRYTPFGNSLTLDFALSAIENMQLGADEVPDFLCLSFSSTDYCGHQFGIHASETEDTYVRLDLDIERLLTYLDKKFGKDNALVFLTADHGGAETPVHMQKIGIPAGVFPENSMEKILNDHLCAIFSARDSFVHEIGSQQVWFNREALNKNKITLSAVKEATVDFLRLQPGVYDAFSREQLMALPVGYPFVSFWWRSVFPRRSGDVFYQLDPAWHSDDKYFKTAGTTHSSSYAYDTHVPLLWHGWKIKPGENNAPISITDIAPTLAAMLRIMEPNGTTGKVIEGIWGK